MSTARTQTQPAWLSPSSSATAARQPSTVTCSDTSLTHSSHPQPSPRFAGIAAAERNILRREQRATNYRSLLFQLRADGVKQQQQTLKMTTVEEAKKAKIQTVGCLTNENMSRPAAFTSTNAGLIITQQCSQTFLKRMLQGG